MSSQKTVTVIGGGIAGLSAAVFLTETGFKVTLIEASPKIGGRAYSFFDKEKEQFFDNGQHILSGWYKNTFEYLEIIGTFDKLNFQKGLEVNFINTDKKVFKLRCPSGNAVKSLLSGLLKFNAFNFKDKLALKNLRKLFSDADEIENIFTNARELLLNFRQTENLLKYFWQPLILAVFNTEPEKVNAKIFLNVLKLGFAKDNSSSLVIPDVNLNELLINDAIKYFERKDVKVFLDKRVTKILIADKVEKLIFEDGSQMISDFYISAVPFFAFKKIFDEKVYYENSFKSELLRPSSIVSVHLFFENKIPEEMIPYNSFGMTGLIGTIVQWIFKRGDRHLSLVISGADDLQITDMSHEEIFELCVRDLNKTIESFDKLKISDYKIIKEKRATFIPDIASNEFRPEQKTRYKNFFIIGDWTDTGLPATIESAVTSSKICVNAISDCG